MALETKSRPETEEDRFDSVMESLDKLNDKVEVVASQRKSGAMLISGYEKDDREPLSDSQKKALRRGRNINSLKELYDNGYQNEVGNSRSLLQGLASAPESSQFKSFKGKWDKTRESALNAMTRDLSSVDAEAKKKAIGQNTFDAERGGVLITPEISNELLQRDFDTLDLAAMCKGFTIGTNTMLFPKFRDHNRKDGLRHGGIVGGYAGEEMTMTPSAFDMDDFRLTLNKMFVIAFASQEALDDTQGNVLTGLIGTQATDALDFLRSDQIFRGDGVKKAIGILNSPGAVTVAKESGQSAATLTAQNILDMYRRRLGNKTKRYAWLYNQNCESQFSNFALGTGEAAQVVFIPQGSMANSPHATLMGLPMIPCEFSAPLGTVGDIALVCLDEYYTITNGGIAEDTSRHVAFLQDQTAFKFTERFDGRLCEDQPIVPYQGDAENDTQSAVVLLATRA